MNKTQRETVLKDTLRYGTANYIVQAIGIINSIALRRFMGPQAMGIWSILQVILGYCGYASFGTTKALMRDYPFLRGKGEHEKAEELKDLVLTFSVLGSLLPAILLLGWLLVRWQGLGGALRVGLLFLAGFLFVQRFYDLLMALLRSDKKFGTLSELIVLNAVGGLGITFLFVSRWNLYGLLFGTALLTFLSLLFIQRRSPYHFKFYWNHQALWKELRLGVPLLIISFLAEFLRSLDKWILARALGFYEVGLYSLAMMASSYLFALPMMFAHVWYPNLQEAYGRTEDPRAVRNYLQMPVFVLSRVAPFLAGLAVFILPCLVHFFLPKFVPGLLAMKIYLIGTYFVLLAQFSSNFLVTIDKYLINIPILIGSVVLNFALNTLLVKGGLGLEGVAGGTTLSFLFYGVASYGAALKEITNFQERIQSLFKLGGVSGVLFGGAFLIDQWDPGKNLLVTSALKMLLFTLLSAPFLWQVEKKTGLWIRLRGVLVR